MCAGAARADDGGMLTSRLAAHPRRTLIAVLLFVVLAGVFGGPVAGALESSRRLRGARRRLRGGGRAHRARLRPRARHRDRAARRRPRRRLAAVARELAGHPRRRVDRRERPGRRQRARHRHACAPARRRRTSRRTRSTRSRAADGVTVGGGDVAGPADRRDRRRGPRARGADRVPDPADPLDPVLPRPRHADAAGRRRHDRARHVPRAVGDQPGLRAERLRAEPRDRARARASRSTTRCSSSPASARRSAGRTPPASATMATAGRTVAFSAVTVAAALITLTVFPQGFLKSMGIAGATVAIVAAVASLVISPALFALWGDKLARKRDDAAEDRWDRLAHAVMRRAEDRRAAHRAGHGRSSRCPALTTTWSAVDSHRDPEGQERPRGGRRHQRRRRRRQGARAGRRSTRPPRSRAEVARVRRSGSGRSTASSASPRRATSASDTWQVRRDRLRRPAGPTAQRVVEDIRALPAPFDVAGRRRRRRVRRPAGGDRLAAAAARSGCSSA